MEFSIFSEEHFMQEALKMADQAFEEEEVPVGAVVVLQKRIIARAHNQTEKLRDVTAHAEMLAITSASEYIGSKYLKGCTLYVTLEPCAMCATALNWSQIDKLVFGAYDPKKGYTLYEPTLMHKNILVKGGVLEEEAGKKMTGFFQDKR